MLLWVLQNRILPYFFRCLSTLFLRVDIIIFRQILLLGNSFNLNMHYLENLRSQFLHVVCSFLLLAINQIVRPFIDFQVIHKQVQTVDKLKRDLNFKLIFFHLFLKNRNIESNIQNMYLGNNFHLLTGFEIK